MTYPLLLVLLASILLCALACAGPSSVVQVWSGVAAFDQAKVNNALATEARKTGKSGGVVMPAVFVHPRERGDATATYRAKLPALAAGERLILSTWCGLTDGVRFDDQANIFNGVGMGVRIGDKLLFRTVLKECTWEPHAVDLAPWAGQEVDLSLVTDCAGQGNASYDWSQFGEPQIVLLRGNALDAAGAARGSGGALLLEYAGAQPDAMLTMRAEGAPGLKVPLADGGLIYREFGSAELGGQDAISVSVQGATLKDLRVCLYQPELAIETLGGESAVSFAGKPLRVAARVRNVGKAALTPLQQATVALQPGGAQVLERLERGEARTLAWELPAQTAGPLNLSATARWATEGEQHEVTENASVAVRAALPELPPDAPTKAELRELPDGTYLLQNPSLRLAFLTEPFEQPVGTSQNSYCGGPVLCFVRSGNDWRQVAVMPPVWEVAEVTHNGTQKRELPVQSWTRDGRVVLSLGRPPVPAEELQDRILQNITFGLADDTNTVEITCTLQSGVDALVRKLAGPKVLVGDGSTGRSKRMALFPGLEYLEGDEESSSTLDAAPPINNRLMPHPYKVTIPLMAVETPDALVALLWDQTRKWDGENATVSAAFASPNFVDGQANHLMQLFLPSCPDWVDENALSADRPYPMKAGSTLTLRHHLVLAAGGKLLDAIDYWAAEYGGIPQPQPEPRDFAAELALSRHGLMKTVWDEQTQKSRHCVDWAPANAPGFATLLLFDARLSGNQEARDRAELIVQRTLAEQGKAGLLAPNCCHILNGELPFHRGYLPDVYADLRRAALGAMGGQGEDGAWRYSPPQGHEDLGKPGTPTIGLTARSAWVLLRYARYTGDERALTAGLKGLGFIDANFPVPRGAQGWECPIHQPDILASAYGVGAYVEAYRATGDRHWLDGARYWARTGLPFIYFWDDPKRPGMRYAGIPCFGTTFFTHSWFGVPVQWCALVYAYHLQHLAEYDETFPWARVAAGITISGMYQQFGDERPELKGCYPDGWYGHFTQRNPPFINPEDILLNRLVMAGHDPDPDTAIAAIGDERFHFTTGATIRTFRTDGDSLRCSLTYFPGEASHGFLAGVARPTVVTLDGRALQPATDLESVPGGWLYDETQAALFVKVTHGREPSELVISGIRRGAPKPAPGRASWDFKGSPQGWHSEHACDVTATPENTLRVTVTGVDPYCASGPASIDATRLRSVVVRARMTAGNALGLFWTTDVRPGFEAAKQATVPLTADGQWHEVAFDLSGHALWEGTVTALRLDPEPADVPAGTVLELARVEAR